jgi:hypothetical protein
MWHVPHAAIGVEPPRTAFYDARPVSAGQRLSSAKNVVITLPRLGSGNAGPTHHITARQVRPTQTRPLCWSDAPVPHPA